MSTGEQVISVFRLVKSIEALGIGKIGSLSKMPNRPEEIA